MTMTLFDFYSYSHMWVSAKLIGKNEIEMKLFTVKTSW